MSPTLLVVALSAVGIAIFLYGVLLMSRRQEGGSGRQPALLMIGGLAVLVLGMMSALVARWTETVPTQPRFEVPGTGVGGLAAPPPPVAAPPAPQATPAPAPQATPAPAPQATPAPAPQATPAH